MLGFTADGGDPSLPVDSIGPWLTSAMDYRFYSPIRSVLDRFAILDYVQEVERLKVAEEREREFVAAQLEPFVANRIRIPDYTSLAPDSAGSRSTKPPPSVELRALLRTRRSPACWRCGASGSGSRSGSAT